MLVHDLYFKTIPQQTGWRARFTNDLIYRLMLAGNSHIATVSNATKVDLERCYPQTKGRITTIHSATSLQPDRGPSSVPAAAGPYVLAVGNATENKNFRVLAEAVATMHSADPNIALVHVGDDPSEIFARTFQQINSPVRLLRFTGIDDAQLADIYRNARCLCVPSLYEGFCLPILEAQVCGCPVVCSNQSAMPEIAGKGAVLFDPTDPIALAASLTSVQATPRRQRPSFSSAGKMQSDFLGKKQRANMLISLPACSQTFSGRRVRKSASG